MMKSKRLYICILWILLAIVLLILIYINKDSTEWQPLITKIVRVYLGLAEQSKPSLYAGSISKPIPFLLSVKGAVPNISKIAQHKALHVLM